MSLLPDRYHSLTVSHFEFFDLWWFAKHLTLLIAPLIGKKALFSSWFPFQTNSLLKVYFILFIYCFFLFISIRSYCLALSTWFHSKQICIQSEFYLKKNFLSINLFWLSSHFVLVYLSWRFPNWLILFFFIWAAQLFLLYINLEFTIYRIYCPNMLLL